MKYIFQAILVIQLSATMALAQVDFLLTKDASGQAGGSLVNPIEIVLANENSIRGLQFDLTYDASVFSVDSVLKTEHLSDLGLFSNEIEPGRHRFLVTDFDGAALGPGSESAIKVYGKIAASAETQASLLQLQNISFTDLSGQSLRSASADGYLFVRGANFVRVNNGHQKTGGDTIDVVLLSEKALGAAQFTLQYDSDFIAVSSFEKTGRSQAMEIQTNEPSPGEIVVVLVSTDGDTIPAGSDAAVRFVATPVLEEVQHPDFGKQRLSLRGLVLSDTEGNEIDSESADGTFLLRHETFPVSVEDGLHAELPETFTLFQNYPNPFNPETMIKYNIAPSADHAALVTIAIYNVLGERVRLLVQERKEPGEHAVAWDGADDAGQVLPSGIYIYTLRVGGFVARRRMLFLK